MIGAITSGEDRQQLTIAVEGDGVVGVVVGPCDIDLSRDRCTGEAGRRCQYAGRATSGRTGTATDLVGDAVIVGSHRSTDIFVGSCPTTDVCNHRTISLHLDDVAGRWQIPAEGRGGAECRAGHVGGGRWHIDTAVDRGTGAGGTPVGGQVVTVSTMRRQRILVGGIASREDRQQLAVTIESESAVAVVVGPGDLDIARDRRTTEAGRICQHMNRCTGGGTGTVSDSHRDAVFVVARSQSGIVIRLGRTGKRLDERPISVKICGISRT